MNTSNFRKDFPALAQLVNGKPLIYFDNGATTQRLQQMVDAYTASALYQNGNIHRSPHYLGQVATKGFEGVRSKIQQFINAKHSCEIVFTRGTTEAINLVAFSYGETFIEEGDEIIITEMEHHSNFVPWQMLCERKNATLKMLPFDEKGELCLNQLDLLISERTKLIAITHISNVLGTINPIEEIVKKAHQKGIHVLVDGAQSIVHQQIDIQQLGCDFFAFSAHKMYGPTGVGVLYGKKDLLEEMHPYQGGGEMISEVTFEKTTYGELPTKFEAGTPDFNGVVAFGATIDYLSRVNMAEHLQTEKELLEYAEEKLKQIDGCTIYGQSAHKTSLISFNIKGLHPFDVGTLLDKMGIAIRTGRLCVDPIMEHFEVESMMRISFAPYNTKEEIDIFYDALLRVKEMLS